MSRLVLLVLAVPAGCGLVTALARTVRGDGWGHRPPPARCTEADRTW